jgi:hypothetical protein
MLCNPRRCCRRWPALAALLGAPWLAAAVAAAPVPPPSPPPSGTAAAASPDPGLVGKLPELTGIVEEYRGLRFERPVPTARSSEAELARKLAAGLRIGAGVAGHDAETLGISLEAFGLIPRGFDLRDYLPKLMGSQVAGFYDPHRKELTLVTGSGGFFGDTAATHYGPTLASRMREGLLVHELTHALQDQHFNLSRLAAGDPLSDSDAARLALVEGDATLTMLAYIGGQKPDELPRTSAVLKKLLADPKLLAAVSAGAPGMAELDAAPAWIRETLVFSYLQGATFCADVLGHGGQRLLDYAFSTDPPRSTAQILHPEKWYGQRDDPDVIAWPDLQAELPGYRKAAGGQLGELGIRILLQEGLHDPQRGAVAAAGWRGDRFAVYRKIAPAPAPPDARGASDPGSARRGGGQAGGGNREAQPPPLLAWIADWATDDDAARFAAAVAALGSDWLVDRAAGNRVVVLRGTVAGAERAALAATLASAHTEPAANRAIDPAAIDAQRKIGAPGKLIAARVAARTEAAQDQPVVEGRLGEDRRTYSFPALGLTLRLPAAMAGWSSKPAPSPSVLLNLYAPQSGTFLQVTTIEMRQPGLSLEMIEPLIEEGMRSSIPGFAKLDGHLIDLGGQQAYELRFMVTFEHRQGLGLGRLFLRGGRFLSVIAMARTERWAAMEPSIKELLDSVAFAPAPGPAAPGPAVAGPPSAEPPPR